MGGGEEVERRNKWSVLRFCQSVLFINSVISRVDSFQYCILRLRFNFSVIHLQLAAKCQMPTVHRNREWRYSEDENEVLELLQQRVNVTMNPSVRVMIKQRVP